MIGLIIIGDEILSGRRKDKHLAAVISMLSIKNIPLAWVRYIPDNLEAIAENLRYAYTLSYPVFSCGGIGGTPDDMTREAAALAGGTTTAIHPIAHNILTDKLGADNLNPNRLKMIEFPIGSSLIENHINGIPGFKFNNVYFVPGFPEMAHSMLENIINLDLQNLAINDYVTRSVLVEGAKESDLVPIMEILVQKYPELKFSSLPSYGNQTYQFPHIDFSFSGSTKLADLAITELEDYIINNQYKIIIR